MKKPTILFLAIMLILLPLTPLNAETILEGGELIKGQSFSAVYYFGLDGKRYVFPNQRIYNSWYADFSTVVTISDEELAAIPMAGNVFYKPNSRLVKVTTDPKTYWVDEFGVLRHVLSEGAAQSLFGTDWVNQIDDLPDAFFAGYTIGDAIDASFSIEVYNQWTIDDNHQLTERGRSLAETEIPSQEEESEEEEEEEEEPVVDEDEQPDSINLTLVKDNQDAVLTWFVTGGNTDYGFAIVKSVNTNPIYPDDDYQQLIDSTATGYTWRALANGSAWYFRVCRLNSDGSCGTYSDNESVAFGVSGKTPSLTLSGQVVDGIVKLSWEKEWLSPDYGFYLTRGTTENPKYPTHSYLWLEKTKESYDWEGLSGGTYHFRICRYTGSTYDMCEYYSNDLELTIE